MTKIVAPMVPLAAPPVVPAATVPVHRDLRAQSIPEFINKAVALIVLKLMFPERRVADANAPDGVRIIPGISQNEIADVIQGEGFRRTMGESFVEYAKRIYLGAPERQNFSFSLVDRVKMSAFSMLRSSGAINVILRSVLNNVIDQVTADPDRVVGNLFQVIDEALEAYRNDLRSFATATEPTPTDGRVAATVQRAPYERFIETAIDSLLPQKMECFTTLRGSQNRIKRAMGNALNRTVGSLFSKAVNYGARRYQGMIVNAVVSSLNGRQIAQIITSDAVVDPILGVIQAQIPGIKRIVELRLTAPAETAPVATVAPAEAAVIAPAARLPQAAKRIGSIMGNAIRLLNVEAVAAERARREEDTRVQEDEAGMLTERLAGAAERVAAPVFNLVYPQLVAFLSEANLAQQLDNASRAVFGHAQTREQELERTARVARNVARLRADVAGIAESTATFAARTGASIGFGVLKGRVTAAVASRTAWMPSWMRTTAKVVAGAAGVGIAVVTFPALGAATLATGATVAAVTAAGGLVAGTAGIQRAGSALLVAPLIDGAPRLATSEALLQHLLEGSLRSYTD